MIYKSKWLLAFFISSIFSYSSIGQKNDCIIEQAKLNLINQMLNDYSLKKEHTLVDYSVEKQTFNFKHFIDSTLTNSYKSIITDIHPEGIYLIEDEGKLHIKLISRCTGNVFIKTQYRNGFLNSNTTNYVLIGGYGIESRKELGQITSLLKSVVTKCVSEKKPNESGRIPLPATKD